METLETQVWNLGTSKVDRGRYWLFKTILKEEGEEIFRGLLLDKEVRGETPLKDILTGKNTDSLICMIKTKNIEEATKWLNFIDETYA